MLTTHMKLSGDLSGDLSRFEAKIKEQVLRAGAGAMAHMMQAEAKANVPVRTGTLRDSIYQVHVDEESSSERQVYRVSWNRSKAPHGHLVEFGTSKMAARPFMRPAFDRIDDAIKAGQERMAEKLKEIAP